MSSAILKALGRAKLKKFGRNAPQGDTFKGQVDDAGSAYGAQGPQANYNSKVAQAVADYEKRGVQISDDGILDLAQKHSLDYGEQKALIEYITRIQNL